SSSNRAIPKPLRSGCGRNRAVKPISNENTCSHRVLLFQDGDARSALRVTARCDAWQQVVGINAVSIPSTVNYRVGWWDGCRGCKMCELNASAVGGAENAKT